MNTKRPRRKHLATAALSGLLCLTLAAPPLISAPQPLGAGAAPKKKPGPITAEGRINKQMDVGPEAVSAFKAAYEKDNEPDILVMVGLDRRLQVEDLQKDRTDLQQGSQKKIRKIQPTPEGGVSDEQTTTNNPDAADTTVRREKVRDSQEHLVGPAGPSLGSNLSLFDESGVTDQLRSIIMEGLRKNRDVELVDISSLSDLDRRDAEILEKNDQQAAIQLAAQKLNAGIALVVKLTPPPPQEKAGKAGARQLRPAEDAGAGPSFKGSFDVIDVRRGRSIGGTSFDWVGGLGNERVRVIGTALASSFMDDYSKWVTERKAPRYDMRLVDFDGDRQLRDLVKLIEKLKGVEKVKSTSIAGGNTRTADLKVTYDGVLEDLFYALQDAAKAELSLEIPSIDVQQGRVVAQVQPLAAATPAEAKPWSDVSVPGTPIFQDFQGAYDRKGRPKVAIVINWLLRPEQTRVASPVKVHEIKLGDDPTFGRNEIGGNTIGLASMEQELATSLRNSGVTILDATAVRRAVAERVKPGPGGVVSEEDLRKALNTNVPWDVLIYGLADIRETSKADPGGNESEAANIQYSLTMTDVRTGEFLGGQRRPDADHTKLRGKGGVDGKDVSSVARYVTGRLLEQLYRNRLASATGMEVTVNGARDAGSVSKLADALKANVSEIVTANNPTFRDGQGRFTIRYSGSYEQFILRLQASIHRVPYSLNTTESGPTRLTLDMKALPQGKE